MKNENDTDILTKILIVDDNKNNILAMKTILDDLPVTLYSAASGEEALTLALEHEFAVIYLDVQMPGMDGYEVIRCLSDKKSTANIPVVLVTALSNDQKSILKGYEYGAIDYLPKPISPEILMAKTKIFINLYQQQIQLKAMVESLDRLCKIDELTRLSNRFQFNVYLEKMISTGNRHQRCFSLLLLDLDNFKLINDVHGHDMGDELLKQVAGRLANSLRISDHISRLGGDEFAMLISEVKHSYGINHFASKILTSLSEPFKINNQVLHTTASIGIATFPFANDTIQGLFKCADVALYRAKNKGKNSFQHFTDSLNKNYLRQSRIEHALLDAMNNNNIHLVYQPKYNMENREVIGVEALARWEHEELGNIPPIEFIRIAEETGHISELGDYLLLLAFKQFQQWNDSLKNSSFHLAINLSPYQFIDNNFLTNIKQMIKTYDINLNQVEFELTESVFKGNDYELENALNSLNDFGACISIDDFGTGYSSMSRLKQLPITVLKIDKSFISEVTSESDNAAIVKAIIALGEALQLNIIAEGVETEEQMDFLLKHGCSQAQGYYFSKPVSATEINKLIFH
ncbi:MAG: EAL domain-containing protein [Coxiellaceae bacterium]|nr:EAL domain-containing protein [Coxiellaceae bacterium]